MPISLPETYYSVWPPSRWTMFFLIWSQNFACFHLSLLSLLLLLCTSKSSPALASLYFPFHLWNTAMKNPLNLFSRLNKPAFLSVSSCIMCSSIQTSEWPSTELPPACPCLSDTWQPRPGPAPDVSHQCWAEVKDPFTELAGIGLPLAAWYAVGFQHWEGTLLFHGQLVVHQDPQTYFCQAAFQLVGLEPSLVLAVIPSLGRILRFPSWILMKFLSAHFSCLMRFLWIAALLSHLLTVPFIWIFGVN